MEAKEKPKPSWDEAVAALWQVINRAKAVLADPMQTEIDVLNQALKQAIVMELKQS